MSPALITYQRFVGALGPGIMRVAPIWRFVGTELGFVASNIATLIPNFAERKLKVSPARIVYSDAHVPGMVRMAPI